ncbi:MAG: hypothetical protein HN534_04190 [Euryarchaeota archaeon]|nr:hypothetical protein [Euryarchaeota archaeon]MBT3654111.1 hypothetical protein [Euryarchaeota archaeon]MBT3757028.1 hypothetical protein [Euryarchaeota archaeon]MBT4050419.1 hypothetical protein [Euryarchaeota archaeon]MBT4346897.1 hypothetical protein [Euryarchaeota archaeon]
METDDAISLSIFTAGRTHRLPEDIQYKYNNSQMQLTLSDLSRKAW